MKYVYAASMPLVPASHENPGDPGVLKKVLITHADLIGGNIQMINWAELLPGRSFVRHVHRDMKEIFICIGGRMRADVHGTVVTLASGDALVVDPGEEHMMENIGDVPAVFIAVGVVPA